MHNPSEIERRLSEWQMKLCHAARMGTHTESLQAAILHAHKMVQALETAQKCERQAQLTEA
jgi:hypothetical protein